jgi:hypothetical protein
MRRVCGNCALSPMLQSIRAVTPQKTGAFTVDNIRLLQCYEVRISAMVRIYRFAQRDTLQVSRFACVDGGPVFL